MSGIVGYGNTPVKIISGFNTNNVREWVFEENGTLRLPEGAGVVDSNGIPVIAGDTFPPASETQLGGVKIDGITININEDDVISAVQYTLPQATDTLLGGIKVDDVTITINEEGVISAVPYMLPTATTSVLGGVKVDGTSITINNGIISVVAGGGGSVGNFTFENNQIYCTNNNIVLSTNFDNSSLVSTNYWLKVAKVEYPLFPYSYEEVNHGGSKFDSQGNCYLAYNYRGPDSADRVTPIIEKSDSSGTLIWRKQLNINDIAEIGNQSKGIIIQHIEVDSENNLVIAAVDYDIQVIKIIKLDSDGKLIFSNAIVYELDTSEEIYISKLFLDSLDNIWISANYESFLIGIRNIGGTFLGGAQAVIDGFRTASSMTESNDIILIGDNQGTITRLLRTGPTSYSIVGTTYFGVPVATLRSLDNNGTNYYSIFYGGNILANSLDDDSLVWQFSARNLNDFIITPFGIVYQFFTFESIKYYDGSLYALSAKKGQGGPNSFWIFKFNATTGDIDWVRSIHYEGEQDRFGLTFTNMDINPVTGKILLSGTWSYENDYEYNVDEAVFLTYPLQGNLLGVFDDWNIFNEINQVQIEMTPPTITTSSVTFSNRPLTGFVYFDIFDITPGRILSNIKYITDKDPTLIIGNSLTFADGTQQSTAYTGYAETARKIGILESWEVAPTLKRLWTRPTNLSGTGNNWTHESYEFYDVFILDGKENGKHFILLSERDLAKQNEAKNGKMVTFKTTSNTECYVVTNTTGGFEDPDQPGTYLFNAPNSFANIIADPNSFKLRDNRVYSWIYREDLDRFDYVFDSKGSENTVVKTVDTDVDVGVPTIVWSGSKNYISGVKLLIQIEASETGDATGWHCQSCEAMISSRGSIGNDSTFGIGTPNISVYGINYTSSGALMTFTVQRNVVTNLIEVVGTTTGIVDTIAYVRIVSTEMISRDLR